MADMGTFRIDVSNRHAAYFINHNFLTAVSVAVPLVPVSTIVPIRCRRANLSDADRELA